MSYSESERNKIIEEYDHKVNIDSYVLSKGISRSSYYKWLKKYGDSSSSNKVTPIDITSQIKNTVESSSICIKANSTTILVDVDYNEELLLRLIRSLNKLWLIYQRLIKYI